MPIAVYYIGAVLIGLALGVGTAHLAVSTGARDTVANGIWSTDLAAGGEDAGLYTRAAIAVHGLLALNRSETLYYFADEDEDGDALNSRCTYVLEGRDPEARWWSVTVYGRDGFLLPEANGRYSASKNSVLHHRDGTFQIALTPDGTGPNGVPTGLGDFTLTLRLYNPDESVVTAPDKADLPRLKRGSCL